MTLSAQVKFGISVLRQLLVRVFVIVAYAAGFNAAVFLPIQQVRAQSVSSAPSAASDFQQEAGERDLSQQVTSPANIGASKEDLSKALQQFAQSNPAVQTLSMYYSADSAESD